MNKFTLKKMLVFYFIALVSAVSVLCVLLWILLITGARYALYFPANSEEKQVERLRQRIVSEQRFDPDWASDDVAYTVFDEQGAILSSNTSRRGQEQAAAFLRGEDISDTNGYFVQVSYGDETCVFQYHIRVRYGSVWANRYLPGPEAVLLILFLLIFLIPVVLYVRAITRRIYRDLAPLQRTVTSIGKGDLNIPVPTLSIYEFQELGNLTERMRVELKMTLESLWVNEHRLRESVTQMLHDYRSPLTVARANAEFLKEDLTDQCTAQTGEKLLKYADVVTAQLEVLSEVADRLQEQTGVGSLVRTKDGVTVKAFNQMLEQTGISLSEHYRSKWESQFQETQLLLPVHEKDFKQVIMNVLYNAFEHGGMSQTVGVTFTETDAEIEYTIMNTGSKFSERALTRAAEKGFSEKREGGQALKGLGLYFAQEFLREHGGRLLVFNTESNTEECACVRIILRLRA